jgi:hypothetical protein
MMMKRSIVYILLLFLIISVYSGCCEDCENIVCPDETDSDTQIITIYRLIGPYYLQWVSGDAEFGSGNGPYVVLEGRIYIAGDDSLMCRAFMSAQEVNGDTRGEREVHEFLYKAPDGWIISYVGMDPDSCTTTYNTSEHGWHSVGCFGWDFMYVGNTPGDDVCWESDCTQFLLGICPQVEIRKR